MNILPETPADYAAIADITYRAFDNLSEPLIVSLLRHRARFDPELSLVAEVDGRVVGHVLFSPQTIRLLGQDVPVVCVAPIAVEPGFQGQGIGKALIEEGHNIARTKGYSLSFLLGHETYYPRFGYITGVYGVSSVEIAADSLPNRGLGKSPLTIRRPHETDLLALRQLWLHEEGGVDFAIYPGDLILDWLSPNPNMDAAVYLRGDQIVGYSRVLSTEPSSPRFFLAADHDAAVEMATVLVFGATSITLPLHPYSASAGAFTIKPEVHAWKAGMACSLAPGLFEDYYGALQAGTRLPGRVIWPIAFDL